jgi:glycosyltransferase involved in cell wall biosynthesis
MRKLKIVQVAPIWINVPPKRYGGIERVVSILSDGLAKRGHKVALFAPATSKTQARLFSVVKQPLIKENVSWHNQIWNLCNLSRAFEMAGDFDIIHCHLDVWGLFFQHLTKKPVLHTMHNRLFLAECDRNDRFKKDRLNMFKQEANRTNIVFISEAMKKLSRVPLLEKNTRVIHNSIDLKNFKFSAKPQGHFIWIARIEKHKGIENAIALAERTGAKLKIAGRIDPTKREYFDQKIKPHLNKNIEYVGELGQKELSKFYGPAKAFLYPIEWEEPFGLVVAESMACGTPVIAYSRGAMPELIENGKTGFLVRNQNEMIAAMKKIDALDRAAIRQFAEEKFSGERMVSEYEKFYYDLINNSLSS